MCTRKDADKPYRCPPSLSAAVESLRTEVEGLGKLDSQGSRFTEEVLQAALEGAIEEALKTLADSGDKAATAGKRGRRHWLCGLFAAIGEACDAIAEVGDHVSETIGGAVAPGNPVLRALITAVVKTWLTGPLANLSGLAAVKQVGQLADVLAQDACPDVPRHPEVRNAERRLAALFSVPVSKGIVDDLIGTSKATQ